MMDSTRPLLVVLTLLALVLGMAACSGDDVPENGGTLPEGPIVASCEGCHTSQEMLIAVAEPDLPPEDEGEG